jgi:galactokinase
MKGNTRELFTKTFGAVPSEKVYSHGRLEIIGNHTDHNHGLCLVAGASMGIEAEVAANDFGIIKIISEGYPSFSFKIDELDKNPQEAGTSLAITRGIAFKLKEAGYKIGGFYAALTSDIFPGAGVSSSACYESLIVSIFSHLFNQDKVSPLEEAKIGQFAEREYFGKPCGLLDQVGTSFGGIDYLDFKSTENPIVENLKWDLPLEIVLVNTGGSHANLTPLYASIPSDMFLVAKRIFGKEYLREVDPADFERWITSPNESVPVLARLRAQHFFDENRRVLDARKAILEHDVDTFLNCIRFSSFSSKTMLQNTIANGDYEHSPQKALDIAERFLQGGAARIMGGGFAGSIICFLYPDKVNDFIFNMGQVYGSKNVVKVSVIAGGPAWGK